VEEREAGEEAEQRVGSKGRGGEVREGENKSLKSRLYTILRQFLPTEEIFEEFLHPDLFWGTPSPFPLAFCLIPSISPSLPFPRSFYPLSSLSTVLWD
jgi:hypothetical protein